MKKVMVVMGILIVVSICLFVGCMPKPLVDGLQASVDEAQANAAELQNKTTTEAIVGKWIGLDKANQVLKGTPVEDVLNVRIYEFLGKGEGTSVNYEKDYIGLNTETEDPFDAIMKTREVSTPFTYEVDGNWIHTYAAEGAEIDWSHSYYYEPLNDSLIDETTYERFMDEPDIAGMALEITGGLGMYVRWEE